MRTFLWAAAAVLAVAYGIYAAVTLDRRPDQERILSLLERTARAVEDRDLSGVVAGISRDYRDESGLTYDRLRVLAAQALRTQTAYRVSADPGPVGIVGDTASVDVRARVMREDGTVIYERTVELELTREKARHALLIPTKTWRITATRNLGVAPDSEW